MNTKQAKQKEEEAKARNKKIGRWTGIVLVILLVLGAVGGGVALANHLANQSAAAADEAADKAELTEEIKAILDVANEPLEASACTVIVERTGGVVTDDTYSLLLETLKGVKEGDASLRQWSDALSTVLKGSTPEEKRSYIERAICEEPIIGVSLANLFANLKVEGVSVLEIQSTDWLKPYAGDAGKINDLVADFMPVTQWKLENLSKKDIPEDVYLAGLTANHKYQELASRLNLLLSKYELVGVKSIASTHHYRLVAGGLVADGIPEVEVSTEVDNRPALVFHLTKKTDECTPMSVLAFNVGDKRPMLGDLVNNCETSVTPPGPGVVNPDCTVNCTSQPPCKVDCNPLEKKDASKDPYNQGNAPDGGGNNNNSGPGEVTDPVQPPDEPYVPPQPPAPQPPSGGTQDPTPPPVVEPQGPQPEVPQTGCDASAPGATC